MRDVTEKIETELKIKLQPRSSQNRILGFEHDRIRVKVTSPPVDGRANNALIDLLAKKLSVSKGSIRIKSGKTGRLKTLSILGLNDKDIRERLEI